MVQRGQLSVKNQPIFNLRPVAISDRQKILFIFSDSAQTLQGKPLSQVSPKARENGFLRRISGDIFIILTTNNRACKEAWLKSFPGIK